MKDANFYSGVYKAIAVAVCMLLFLFVVKAKAAEKKTIYKSNIELTLKYHK
ncbi:MAG TPA: hypothetical protein PK504_13040 [Ferruginibacter sp.]|nr:hypothetical protein [Ferruginibacter sp.]HRE64103.1 hypothetical protein [Ferruginibacter sp.]